MWIKKVVRYAICAPHNEGRNRTYETRVSQPLVTFAPNQFRKRLTLQGADSSLKAQRPNCKL
jgi:hypothetical protein